MDITNTVTKVDIRLGRPVLICIILFNQMLISLFIYLNSIKKKTVNMSKTLGRVTRMSINYTYYRYTCLTFTKYHILGC